MMAWRYPEARLIGIEAQDERIEAAARAAGLARLRRTDVVPRHGKAPLFSVRVFAAGDGAASIADPPLTVRGADGCWTDAFRSLRRDMGLPS